MRSPQSSKRRNCARHRCQHRRDGSSPLASEDRSSSPLVVGEVARQLTWSDTEASMFHWRNRDGAEVDIVLKRPNGDVVGTEVKASFDLHAGDSKGLRALRDRLGPTFVTGIVLYCGDRVQRLDDRILAMPISALWSPRSRSR